MIKFRGTSGPSLWSLVGYRVKTYNFLIFKLIINYYIMAPQSGTEFGGYHKFKQSTEIKPFWKN